MWVAQSIVVNNNVHKISLFEDKNQLCYRDVIRYWGENYEFREFYVSLLKESSFDSFFWEHPPLTTSNAKQAYEFVLVNSPQLSQVSADPKPFLAHFISKTANQSVIAFENLGRDAELIVPCLIVAENRYAHLAAFVRNAPKEQAHELFMVLANSLKNRIGTQPTWVSTSGLGVYWLHIRLDTRPKYYSHQPYKEYIE